MDIKSKMADGYRELQGGLFSAVSKADVGTAVSALIDGGAMLMCWADPFYPDPVIPDHVQKAALEAAEGSMASHYTMPIGNPELKKEVAKKLKIDNGLDVDPERNIIITPGSDSGLLFAMMPFICPRDEVLVHDPGYPSNFINPRLLGGVTVSVPLHEENNYQIDIEEYEKRLTSRTKMVLLTNPNNPTTTVFRRDSLEKLADFIISNDLILVVDQAFEDAIYDDIEFVSMAALPGMWERTVSVFSVSKGMALSGYRVGYVVADDKIMDVMYGCAVNILGATNTASQIGVIAAMRDRSFIKEYNKIFDMRRKYAYEIFNSIPGVSMTLPESGFMSWLNISKLGTAEEISKYIIKHANVVINEGTPYGKNGAGHIRIVHGCYRDDKMLYEGLNRIKASLTEFAKEKGLD